MKETLNISCVQVAVDAREGTIDQAFATYSGKMTTALTARKTALHNAWGITDATARKSARDAAWTAYKTAAKAAHTELKTTKQKAWSDFKTASKACHVPVVESQSVSTGDTISL